MTMTSRLAALAAAVEAGGTRLDIARRLGCSVRSLRRWATAAGVTLPDGRGAWSRRRPSTQGTRKKNERPIESGQAGRGGVD